MEGVNQPAAVGVNILTTVKRLSKITDSVIIGFSCGKDSLVMLDLCRQHFKKLYVFFMYLVEGLEFQESYLRYIEQKYEIKIVRLPHWQIADLYKSCSYMNRKNDYGKIKILKINDIENYVRQESGFEWIGSGMKVNDSMQRRGMLKHCQGINFKTKRFYPVMNFSDKAIYSYLNLKKIKLPPDYQLFGRSFGRLWGEELAAIKKYFPEDYKKILEVFPYAEAAVKRLEYATN